MSKPAFSRQMARNILGVSQTATDREVVIAYRNLARQVAPDKGGDHEKMVRANLARDLLLSPELNDPAAPDFDDEDDDAAANSGDLDVTLARLHVGKVFSDTVRELLITWEHEYDPSQLLTTYEKVMASLTTNLQRCVHGITAEITKCQKLKQTEGRTFKCSFCTTAFTSEASRLGHEHLQHPPIMEMVRNWTDMQSPMDCLATVVAPALELPTAAEIASAVDSVTSIFHTLRSLPPAGVRVTTVAPPQPQAALYVPKVWMNTLQSFLASTAAPMKYDVIPSNVSIELLKLNPTQAAELRQLLLEPSVSNFLTTFRSILGVTERPTVGTGQPLPLLPAAKVMRIVGKPSLRIPTITARDFHTNPSPHAAGQCNHCQKKVTSVRSDFCRSCGNHLCQGCGIPRILPTCGMEDRTRICPGCAIRVESEEVSAWLQLALEHDDIDSLALCLALFGDASFSATKLSQRAAREHKYALFTALLVHTTQQRPDATLWVAHALKLAAIEDLPIGFLQRFLETALQSVPIEEWTLIVAELYHSDSNVQFERLLLGLALAVADISFILQLAQSWIETQNFSLSRLATIVMIRVTEKEDLIHGFALTFAAAEHLQNAFQILLLCRAPLTVWFEVLLATSGEDVNPMTYDLWKQCLLLARPALNNGDWRNLVLMAICSHHGTLAMRFFGEVATPSFEEQCDFAVSLLEIGETAVFSNFIQHLRVPANVQNLPLTAKLVALLATKDASQSSSTTSELWYDLGVHQLTITPNILLAHVCFILSAGAEASKAWEKAGNQLPPTPRRLLSSQCLVMRLLNQQNSPAFNGWLSLLRSVSVSCNSNIALELAISIHVDVHKATKAEQARYYTLLATILDSVHGPMWNTDSLIMDSLNSAQVSLGNETLPRDAVDLQLKVQARIKKATDDARKPNAKSLILQLCYGNLQFEEVFEQLCVATKLRDADTLGEFREYLGRRAGDNLSQMQRPDQVMYWLVIAAHSFVIDRFTDVAQATSLCAPGARFLPTSGRILLADIICSVDFVEHSLLELQHTVNECSQQTSGGKAVPTMFTSAHADVSTDAFQHEKLFRLSGDVKAIRKCEKAVFAMVKGGCALSEVALNYLNIFTAGVDQASRCVSLLQSAKYFFLEMQNRPLCSARKRFALKRAACLCMELAAHIAARSVPALSIFTARQSAALLWTNLLLPDPNGRISHTDVISSDDVELFGRLISLLRTLTPVFPLLSMPAVCSFDAIFVFDGYRQLQEVILSKLLRDVGGDGRSTSVLPAESIAYLVLEGHCHGWLRVGLDDKDSGVDSDSDVEAETEAQEQLKQLKRAEKVKQRQQLELQVQRDSENESRVTCMSELLLSKHWNFDHVTKLTNMMPLFRSADGFQLQDKTVLPGEGQELQYSELHGFDFDVSSGLQLRTSSNRTLLFGNQDIAEVLRSGISDCVFTLNQPDTILGNDAETGEMSHLHPFQQMCFLPENLRGTRYLGVMFQADYLLKFLSTGVEVSALPPFALRETVDGLLQRLPERLRRFVRPVREREASEERGGRAHRFWIEVESIPFEDLAKDDNNRLQIRFGHVKMIVKKHLLTRNAIGELVDAPTDSDDRSAEASFARDMTEHYDELANYFPELAAVREQVKIAALYKILLGHYLGRCQAFSEPRLSELRRLIETSEKERWRGMLAQLPSWPLENDSSKVSEEVNRVVRKTVQHYRDRSQYVNSRQESDLRHQARTEIIKQMREADQQILQQMVDLLPFKQASSARQACRSLLADRNINPLVELSVEHHIAVFRGELEQLRSALMQYKICLMEPRVKGLVSTPLHGTECGWVPAAYCHRDQSLTYGGVNLNVALREHKGLDASAGSPWRVHPSVLNAQRAHAAPWSTAVQLDNFRAYQQRFVLNRISENAMAQRIAAANQMAANRQQQANRQSQAQQALYQARREQQQATRSAAALREMQRQTSYVTQQQRLHQLATDSNAAKHLSKSDRGWLKNELRRVEFGNSTYIRSVGASSKGFGRSNYDMAHLRGQERARGNDFSNAVLQHRDLHRLQHHYDRYGKAYAKYGIADPYQRT